MTTDEMKVLVKANLNITDKTKDLIITDVIQEALNYCNLAELPESAETFIRKKVRGIINYEAENGTASVFDIKSIKEGDASTTYNVDEKTSKETIYGLSDRDKRSLHAFRRLRR